MKLNNLGCHAVSTISPSPGLGAIVSKIETNGDVTLGNSELIKHSINSQFNHKNKEINCIYLFLFVCLFVYVRFINCFYLYLISQLYSGWTVGRRQEC